MGVLVNFPDPENLVEGLRNESVERGPHSIADVLGARE
jgi:hypothetical protein